MRSHLLVVGHHQIGQHESGLAQESVFAVVLLGLALGVVVNADGDLKRDWVQNGLNLERELIFLTS